MAELPELIEDLDAFSVRTSLLRAEPKVFRFKAGAPWRAAAAGKLAIPEILRLEGSLEARLWRDGVEVKGAFEGEAVQTCGVTLEPIHEDVAATFEVRLLPEGSPNFPEISEEVVIDPLAEDPPDLLQGDVVDLGQLVFEHFALELDPFPRKPDARFEPPEEPQILSPFSVLKPRPS